MLQNYYKLMEKELAKLNGMPRLLLHSCCGPCSSAVLQLLAEHFHITVFFFNPNIYPGEEFEKRLQTQRELVKYMFPEKDVHVLEAGYDHSEFTAAVTGLEAEPEGGERCRRCFELRLANTARVAEKKSFDYFTTTLSVSPHKNAESINGIGLELSGRYEVKYLASDFKKKDGYKKSIGLSKKYGLYRQDYCGCEFSANGLNSSGK